jgi:hypothetical protein
MILPFGVIICAQLIVFKHTFPAEKSLAASQQDCRVLMESLTGTYEGECKKKLADGYGTAKGTDTYEGYFKKGLPHGKGKYIWKNGDEFEGEWKKGVIEGAGRMVYKRANLPDSVITGFWEKGEYIGLYRYPYAVTDRSSNITNIDFTLLNVTSNRITFSIFSGRQLDIGEFVITPTEGLYDAYKKTTKLVEISGIKFPFTAFINAPPYNFNFTINRPGNWEVRLEVDLEFSY